jgi:hypothetical protein
VDEKFLNKCTQISVYDDIWMLWMKWGLDDPKFQRSNMPL